MPSSEPEPQPQSVANAPPASLAQKGLARGASIVAVGTLVSRLLGLARDMTLAAVFGRGVTDAFFVAFRIPNALRQIVGEGAMSSSVIPVLAKVRAENPNDGGARVREVYARLRGVSLIALVALTGLGVLFAEPLTELFAGGLHARSGAFELATHVTRGIFPYIFFMGSAALGAAALQVERRFFTTSFAPALLNVSFVVCAWTLPRLLPSLGARASDALIVAVLLGGLLQMVAQWPELWRAGYMSRPQLSFRDPALRLALARFVPQLLGVGVYYIDIVLASRFLAGLEEGSQSWFMWAQRVCDFPQGIFVMAISTAALPALSELATREDKTELRVTFSFGLRLALYVAIPSSVALLVLGEPLVRLLFERGAFDHVSTHETARALRWQGAAIALVAVARQTTSLFFALGSTRTVTIVSAIDLVVFIGVAWLLRGPWGHEGVSAAVFASTLVQAGLLAVLANRRVGGGLGLWRASLGIGVAAAAAAGAGFGVSRALGPRTLGDVLGLVTFAIVYVAATWVVGLEDARTVTRAFARRLRRR